jgi:hypothetical protein
MMICLTPAAMIYITGSVVGAILLLAAQKASLIPAQEGEEAFTKCE